MAMPPRSVRAGRSLLERQECRHFDVVERVKRRHQRPAQEVVQFVGDAGKINQRAAVTSEMQ